MAEKRCLQCGEPIHRQWPGELRRAVFCDVKCRTAYQREHPTNERGKRAEATCATCGKTFSFYPSVRPAARYCSNACRHAGHAKAMRGRRPSRGRYRSTASFRQMVRLSFMDRCAICGWDEAPCDVCHIEPRKRGGPDVIENVVMLCPNHHRLLDRGQLDIERVREARRTILRTP